VAYTLEFLEEALNDWNALDGSVKATFKKQLEKRLQSPHVLGDALPRELLGCYKIKLRKQGYRLIYIVEDAVLIVLVVAVGKREDDAAYEAAAVRVRERVTTRVAVLAPRKKTNRK
jgi:mRNA interferase RelE/StbE